MIRLLLRLLRITDFEPCSSCDTLKRMLAFEKAEKKELTETLLRMLNPKVVELPAAELTPVTQSAGLFSRRRAALEERDRLAAKTLKESNIVGRPDAVLANKNPTSIEELETELGIEEKKEA